MRKFWTFRPNAGYGLGHRLGRYNEPDLLIDQIDSYTCPADLIVAEPGAAPEANHKHTVIGPVALPSTGAPDGHWHWVLNGPDGKILQQTVGAAHHTHSGNLYVVEGREYIQPKFHMILLTCSDAQFAALQAYGVEVYAERQASQDPDTSIWSFAPLDAAQWGAGKRGVITNRLNNQLGLDLPAGVDSDKEFIVWMLNLGAWQPENESKHG